MEIEHPRWGIIQSVTPLYDLKAGNELFTNYGYGKADFPNDFPWYWETIIAIERQERIEREEKEKVEKQKEKEEKSKKKGKKQKKMNDKKRSSKDKKKLP